MVGRATNSLTELQNHLGLNACHHNEPNSTKRKEGKTFLKFIHS